MSIFKEKKAKFEMNLSGTKISFVTSEKFSPRYGFPESFGSKVNIFDPNNYPKEPSERHLFSVFILYWDYISGVLIKDKDGTMVMKISVEKIAEKTVSIVGIKELQAVLPENFKATYTNKKRKEFEVVDPYDFNINAFPSGEWLNYRYEISQMDEIAYSIPFVDTHYLTVSFELMLGHNEESFLKKANKHIQEIMNSFKITPP
jgi:hypothetical protein